MKKVFVAFVVLAGSISHAGVMAGDVSEANGRKTRVLIVNVQPSPFTRVQLTADENGDIFEIVGVKLTNEVEKFKAELKAKEKAEKLAKELLHESCFLQYGGALLDGSIDVKASEAVQETISEEEKRKENMENTVSIVGSARVEATCEVELFNVKDLVKEIWKSIMH